jgi:DNA-binding IclR family transcriptional regulator
MFVSNRFPAKGLGEATMNERVTDRAEAAGGEASSLERMIGLLDLFEESGQRWSFDEIHARLGYTRSTLYRYLKVLTDAEILTSLPGVGFTLGPRIAELDYCMRARDPLIVASRPVMIELAADFTGITLLCRRYRDKVLCVHQEQGNVGFRSTYERGLALPLLRGAASRIILANLSAPKLARLYAQQTEAFAAAGLGGTLDEVRATLKRIRSDGYDVTTEQVTSGLSGIAAPLFDAQHNVLGSLSVTLQSKALDPDDIKRIAERVMFGARIVTGAISQ